MNYRKKPVTVQAVQFLPDDAWSFRALYTFCGEALGPLALVDNKWRVQINTLEDGPTVKHYATEGDWIVRGVQGEFYACKPEIFEQTYEKVEAS
jgi:hypothetical protein